MEETTKSPENEAKESAQTIKDAAKILKEAADIAEKIRKEINEGKKETLKLIEEEAPKFARFIIVKENLFQSIIADILTFGALIGVIAINYQYFENSTFGAWMLGIMFFIMISAKAKQRSKEIIGKENLIKYLEHLKNH